MTSREVKIYDIIARNAESNIAMLNEIRTVYGRQPLSKDSLVPILKGCQKELLSDLILDKILGNLPLVGFPANMLCAKAMTWRLGILFGMLAARGEVINRIFPTH